jgi:hypothetical protein
MPSKILLDQNSSDLPFFFAGDIISGRVELTTTSRKTCTKACINFYSSEEINVQNGNIRLSGKCKNFDLTLNFIETPQKLEKGTISFAFSFSLPLSTRVATLGPIQGNIREHKFLIKNELQFIAQFKGFLSSDEKSTIPVPIAPLWAPNLSVFLKEREFNSVLELERSCDCFEDKKYAKVQIQGFKEAVHFAEKVCLPFSISVQHSAEAIPLRVNIQMFSKTRISHFYAKELNKMEHYSGKFVFHKENDKLSKVSGEISFNVATPFSLMTAKGSYWNRELYWKIEIQYRGGYLTTTRLPVVACILASNQSLSEVQKTLIEYAYLFPKSPKIFEIISNEKPVQEPVEEVLQQSLPESYALEKNILEVANAPKAENSLNGIEKDENSNQNMITHPVQFPAVDTRSEE